MAMDVEMAWAAVAQAPFAAQVRVIEQALEARKGLATLVRLTASLRDHEPFARLLAGLLADGHAGDSVVRTALAEAFSALPAAGLARALGAGSLAGDGAARSALAGVVAKVLRGLAVEQVAESCLMLRWLGRSAPGVLAMLRDDAVAQLEALLTTGEPEAAEDRALLLVPGSALAALDALAAQHEVAPAWQVRRAAFAERLLAVLGSQPKPLSLARAEELLSQQIYTDSGHFLAELLQNADDAGARTWRVRCLPDAVEIWHDGAPFDARDVVGVLSIGQTTKTAAHIGLFGVGFKAVYAVCERPQIYSDVFSFEIADVSIPRPLARRVDEGNEPAGTRVVLPLRSPEDAVRGSAALQAHALALPAEVLLTLRHVRTLEILGSVQRRVTRRPGPAEGVEVLAEEGAQGRRQHTVLLATAPTTEEVLAIALDAGGAPQPWPAAAPSVYAFLPTRQRSGLPFLVHARFRVPVDRERIFDDAPNRAALHRLGGLFAGLLRTRVAEGLDVRRLAAVAPRAVDLHDPVFGAVAEGFAAGMAGLAWLRDAEGTPVAPPDAWLVPDEALARALSAAPGRRSVGLLPARVLAVATDLGARALEAADLRALLAQGLQADWLRAAMPVVLRFLARQAWSVEGLAELPIFPDTERGLRPLAALRRASSDLRPLAARPLLDASLDADPTLGPLWAKLKLPFLTPAEVLADLATHAAAITARAGAARVLRWLAAQSGDLSGLSTAPFLPDESGVLRPATGTEAVWLPPEGPLGGWLRPVRPRPPLASPEVIQHRDLLRRLGVRTLDLPAILDLYASQALAISDTALDALHRVLAHIHLDLPGRHLEALAAAAIFPTSAGDRRPLVGPGRALVPAEEALRVLLPGVPWLRADLATELGHIARLPVVALTADHLARALAGRPPAELHDVAISDVGAALAFVAARADRIGGPTRQALALAPLWPARDGTRHPLAALRGPAADPRVAAVYRLLDAWPPAAPEALERALALGLDEALRTPDLARMVVDLAAAGPTLAALPDAVLFPALAGAGESLPPSRLAPLADLPIYPTVDNERVRLGHWDAIDLGGAHRVPEALAEALEHTARRRLAPSAEQALLPLLEALRFRPAGLPDLVAAVAEFGPHAAALEATRATLVRLGPALPPGLDALPIWPTAAGGYAGASRLIRPRALRESDLVGIIEVPPEGLLDASAEPDADQVVGRITFRTPISLLLGRLNAEARLGEPLRDQPPWLASPGQVGRLLAAAATDPTVDPARLPLAVDAHRCLVAGPRLEATYDEIATVARTPLMARLAEPTWAVVARQVEPALAPRLSVRSWLEALAEHTTLAIPVEAHPTFADPEARQALYRAVMARADVIAADEAARAALGRSCVLPTPDGLLRSPNTLLFEPGPPGLELAWNPTDEVPEALCQWLRLLFALEKKRLHTLVEHVLTTHQAAAEAGDGPQSAALLGFLARALRVEPDRMPAAQEVAERFKLGRRLRIQAVDGTFHRPKLLFVPLRDDVTERLAAFLPGRPLEPHPRYDEATRALVRASGAASDLAEDALKTLLDDLGLLERERRLAFARYLFDRVAAAPRLVEALGLRDRAWVPDEAGGHRPPTRLYWHTPEVVGLLGEARDLFPAAAVRTGVAESTWRRLGFRGADDARIADVLARVPPGGALDEVVLRWLDDQLEANRLTAEATREALGDRPWFIADDDTRHAARTLIRDLPPGELGQRRGGFSVGRTLPRLVAALRIPIGPAPRHYLDFLEEIGTAYLSQGDALLKIEPELADTVPRAWSRLAAADAAPARGVVVADGPAGLVPCWTSDPRLVWPTPLALVAAARAAGVGLLAAHLGDAPPALFRQALAAAGVPTADGIWEETRAPIALQPGQRVEGALMETLAALWSMGPALRRRSPHWRADFGRVPQVQSAGHISREGRLLGAVVTWPVPAAVVGNALVLHDGESLEGLTLADALCRDRLTEGRPKPDQVALVADLIACGHARAMALLLEARPDDAAAEPARRGPPPLPPDATPPAPPAEPKAGLLSRFRRWLGGEGDEAGDPPPQDVPPAVVTPPQGGTSRSLTSKGFTDAAPSSPMRTDHERFFRPGESVGPQLNDGRAWLEDRSRPAAFGFATAPRQLPPPWLYGPNLIADHFDPRTQHWTAERIDPAWSAPAAEASHRLSLAGRLPAGESVLPVPLYGRLLSVDAHPASLVIRTPGGLPLISTTTHADVRCEIALDGPPDFSHATEVHGPSMLLRPTVPDTELPAECHALVDRIGGLGPLDRALAIRDFIRASYRYDPTRFEDPRLAAWLKRLSAGRANAQLAALHAGRDARHLGAGVCYELNVLAVELLRRASIPAAVATGWVFDRGQVDEPDHLWAMALLGTPAGPRWLPIDASTTREGRPLRVRPRLAARWGARLPERSPEPPKPASWSNRPAHPEVAEPIPLADLMRVVQHVSRLTGEDLTDEVALRSRCRALLADPETAARLLDLLKGG